MRLLTFTKWVKKMGSLDRFLIVFVVIGTMLALVSLFRGIVMDRQVQVEYLEGGVSGQEKNNIIIIDIEGAVTSPGVYEMHVGDRIKDVLIKAGGLAISADREYCEKNVNMAEEIKDGQKIYIPSSTKTEDGEGYPEAELEGPKVSINRASVAELDTLWGVGPAKAESIVKNRPYQNVHDLVTKKVLSQSVVDHNIQILSVY